MFIVPEHLKKDFEEFKKKECPEWVKKSLLEILEKDGATIVPVKQPQRKKS